jgi:hypothetical protein
MRMADHLGSYLDELVPERPKRPLLHWLGQCKRDPLLRRGMGESIQANSPPAPFRISRIERTFPDFLQYYLG